MANKRRSRRGLNGGLNGPTAHFKADLGKKYPRGQLGGTAARDIAAMGPSPLSANYGQAYERLRGGGKPPPPPSPTLSRDMARFSATSGRPPYNVFGYHGLQNLAGAGSPRREVRKPRAGTDLQQSESVHPPVSQAATAPPVDISGYGAGPGKWEHLPKNFVSQAATAPPGGLGGYGAGPGKREHLPKNFVSQAATAPPGGLGGYGAGPGKWGVAAGAAGGAGDQSGATAPVVTQAVAQPSAEQQAQVRRDTDLLERGRKFAMDTRGTTAPRQISAPRPDQQYPRIPPSVSAPFAERKTYGGMGGDISKSLVGGYESGHADALAAGKTPEQARAAGIQRRREVESRISLVRAKLQSPGPAIKVTNAQLDATYKANPRLADQATEGETQEERDSAIKELFRLAEEAAQAEQPTERRPVKRQTARELFGELVVPYASGKAQAEALAKSRAEQQRIAAWRDPEVLSATLDRQGRADVAVINARSKMGVAGIEARTDAERLRAEVEEEKNRHSLEVTKHGLAVTEHAAQTAQDQAQLDFDKRVHADTVALERKIAAGDIDMIHAEIAKIYYGMQSEMVASPKIQRELFSAMLDTHAKLVRQSGSDSKALATKVQVMLDQLYTQLVSQKSPPPPNPPAPNRVTDVQITDFMNNPPPGHEGDVAVLSQEPRPGDSPRRLAELEEAKKVAAASMAAAIKNM